MKRLILMLALSSIACAPVMSEPAAPPVAPARASVDLSGLDALARRYVAENKTPGIAMAIGVGDAPTTFISAGKLADDPNAPVATPDSLWRVYSMTKPVTAMAAMILIEEGKLRLDQPIAEVLPEFAQMKVLTDPAKSLDSRPTKTPITVRHLLTHTAGLGYSIVTTGPLLNEYNRLGLLPAAVNVQMEAQMAAARPDSLQEFARRVASAPLIAEPGTVWSYSISLDVLGAVIEKASGMPFDRFVQTRLFDPLKMTSSYWTVPESAATRLATNYTFVGENRIPVDPGIGSLWTRAPEFPYGGAGLVMSARDYDRFLHMLQNKGELDGARVMKRETAELAMSNLLPPGVDYERAAANTGGDRAAATMGYGAGGSVYLADKAGGAGAGTYGWGGAAGTVAWVDPKNGVRGTIMVNYFPSDKWPLRDEATKAVYADIAAR
ncbi:serine hydrolase domain-containing protein [Sphingomonas sp. FW199]|uniref:serine hydrolase domain-containing protein n=1 Tax=Sphingomonas sp. FW199 TaxID=3400217 RepID=UPI003CF71528